MKKIFSKKYIITGISSFTLGTGIILACGGDWEPEYNSSFTPEAFVDSTYRPFFYSEWLFYYGKGHDTEHDSRFNSSNINDWCTYLGIPIADGEVSHLQLSASSAAIDSASLYLSGKAKALPSTMQSFQLFKRSNKKLASFISYLSLAKKCEAFALSYPKYSWEYETKKNNTDTVNAIPLNNELLQEFTKTKDDFLKERYWFQLVRSYFFTEPHQQAIDLFENNEKVFPKNELYYRAMAYAAGAYYKLKNYSKANYYYSKVYDGCDLLKTVAHFSFHPQEEKDWKATLAMCVNNDEKATLWQMLGIFYSDEKRAIREIYSLNPRSEKLNLLLSRTINIQEQRYSTWDDGIRTNRFQIQSDSTTKELSSLVSRIAQAGNTNKPYMWQMAAGYLHMLNGNSKEAATWYALAGKKLPGEELPQQQLRLLKIINTIASTTKADSKLEKTILPELEWLKSIQPEAPLRSGTAFGWIRRTMADRYIKQKEFIKAVCFSNYPAFYVDNNNVEAMKSFLNKTNKTPYESLCAKMYTLTLNELVEYQAIDLALQDKIGEAIIKLESLFDGRQLPGNPFNGRIQDCHDCDHDAVQKIKYTRLSLLKKMKDMEDKIKAGNDVYNNAMLVANAHYNITHYGNARAFYECRVLGEYHYSPYTIDSAFRRPLTDMKQAIKYYTLALTTAKTDEQKAKCHFMLAKCERNEWYNKTMFNNSKYEYGDRQSVDFLPWNGFKSLQQYSNTQFYKEAIKECGYFRTYTQK
ncbi:hypothetical protein FAM09_19295 [Niastella caeni]|uniref:Tetratricopeptide repeat protein n=1 Tax=Niastella caeni TaxID=2569763 RepID=A0A4S8HRE3_9BACT|nr:hypothetical protein [Niastella caeni]THU37099.1 hypothetical protein FAM09_19295 [Niastella caeni]